MRARQPKFERAVRSVQRALEEKQQHTHRALHAGLHALLVGRLSSVDPAAVAERLELLLYQSGVTIGALLLAAVTSRVEGVRVLASLPVARAYGASAAVGKPSLRVAMIAIGLGLAIAAIIGVLCGLPLWGVIAGLVLGNLAVSVLAGLARRLIGGQTGDIAGAAQQLAEIGVYVGLAAGFAS